jgi:isopenicillin-N N-acyltransferase-like protein
VEAGLSPLRSEGATDDAVRTIVRTAMTDHFGHPDAVCQHADPRRHELDRCITVVSSLVDLTTGTYHLTHGVPCSNSYQQLPWNLYDGPAAEDRPDVPAPGAEFAGIR